MDELQKRRTWQVGTLYHLNLKTSTSHNQVRKGHFEIKLKLQDPQIRKNHHPNLIQIGLMVKEDELADRHNRSIMSFFFICICAVMQKRKVKIPLVL